MTVNIIERKIATLFKQLEIRTMTSRQTTIQSEQLATRLSVCIAASMHSWAPSTGINLFGRGYKDPSIAGFEEEILR